MSKLKIIINKSYCLTLIASFLITNINAQLSGDPGEIIAVKAEENLRGVITPSILKVHSIN